jgi:hypothetical protein
LGQHTTCLTRLYSYTGWAGISSPAGPEYLPAGWAKSPLGRRPPPAGPRSLCRGLLPSRLGRRQRTPAWAGAPLPRLGWSVARPRLGRRPFLLMQASFSTRTPAGPPSAHARLGRIRRIWPGRDFSSRPPFTRPGWASLECSGWARPALPWPMLD